MEWKQKKIEKILLVFKFSYAATTYVSFLPKKIKKTVLNKELPKTQN